MTSTNRVSFSTDPPKVHKIIAWKHAYHMARIGHWQNYARDADRFKQRITNTSLSLDWVLKREHRSKVFFQRFRPILMRQKREELLEAKAKAKEKEIREAQEKELQEAQEKEAQLIKEQEMLEENNSEEPIEDDLVKNCIDLKLPSQNNEENVLALNESLNSNCNNLNAV